MGRWQTRLATAEKNANTAETETDKTPKTYPAEVLGVLGGRHPGKYENFSSMAPLPSDADVAAAEWEERAAILEYDEGLPRDEAERLAMEQFVGADNFTAPRTTECSVVVERLPPTGSFEQRPGTRTFGRTLERSKVSNCKPELGISILRPAVEVEAAEYDAHLDAMIAALPAGSDERARLAFAKRKGWCVERDDERIFVRGRA